MKYWKRMLIGCLAAVQFTAFLPSAYAEMNLSPIEQPALEQKDKQEQNDQTGHTVNESNESNAQNEQQRDQTSENQTLENELGNVSERDDMLNMNVGSGTGTLLSKDEQFRRSMEEKMKNFDYATHGNDVLVLIANSNLMFHNGVAYKSPQPITVKKGVSYIALRSLVERFGLSVNFDNKTKETIISNGGSELRYKANTSYYRVDGKSTRMSGSSYIQNGTFMVPITSAMKSFNMPYQWDNVNKRIIVRLDAPPVAKFNVVEKQIYAGQTRVTVNNESYSPRGRQIIEEQWEGLQDYYEDPGTYVVSLRVLDDQGEWSNTHSVTINVLPPNQAPIAEFRTDKTTYKMGEIIRYEDISRDPENDIAKREWANNEPAFFTPGPQTITLKVTDGFGATHEVEHTIIISEETLYTVDEFSHVHTSIGEKYAFRASIKDLAVVKPEVSETARALYRANSPESIVEDGILYTDNVAGGARILMHHKNAKNTNIKLYIMVKNISDRPATVQVERSGWAGPSTYPQQTGKMAAVRYFESFAANANVSETTLQPNETRMLVPDVSQRALKPQEIYTLYADFYSDTTVEYSVVALDESKNVVKELPKLKKLKSDGVHIRGTFENADRNFAVKEVVGDKPSRLLFADKVNDPYIKGSDMIDYVDQVNAGNYGVLYRVMLERVAPNTLISFNSRGGSYSGAMLVNGQVIHTPNHGILNGPNEASVVYRTGNHEERVELWFTPAAGNNMPVNLVFTPLPKPRS
ncbi:stalk domain-containing protein [Paenibacillus sp. 481]|uniref:stalk domain-containing protein n=1 Tax=Paenibacillus sp. 481 TaxID=2835869 RepID=UPI001E433F3E|nr:stalk domain-containing protein [Paenibacillus sp. 481]UHA72849.1 copper amine oxidase N-terminal domain-containing protein [Paenibacillus sp. 481]